MKHLNRTKNIVLLALVCSMHLASAAQEPAQQSWFRRTYSRLISTLSLSKRTQETTPLSASTENQENLPVTTKPSIFDTNTYQLEHAHDKIALGYNILKNLLPIATQHPEMGKDISKSPLIFTINTKEHTYSVDKEASVNTVIKNNAAQENIVFYELEVARTFPEDLVLHYLYQYTPSLEALQTYIKNGPFRLNTADKKDIIEQLGDYSTSASNAMGNKQEEVAPEVTLSTWIHDNNSKPFYTLFIAKSATTARTSEQLPNKEFFSQHDGELFTYVVLTKDAAKQNIITTKWIHYPHENPLDQITIPFSIPIKRFTAYINKESVSPSTELAAQSHPAEEAREPEASSIPHSYSYCPFEPSYEALNINQTVRNKTEVGYDMLKNLLPVAAQHPRIIYSIWTYAKENRRPDIFTTNFTINTDNSTYILHQSRFIDSVLIDTMGQKNTAIYELSTERLYPDSLYYLYQYTPSSKDSQTYEKDVAFRFNIWYREDFMDLIDITERLDNQSASSSNTIENKQQTPAQAASQKTLSAWIDDNNSKPFYTLFVAKPTIITQIREQLPGKEFFTEHNKEIFTYFVLTKDATKQNVIITKWIHYPHENPLDQIAISFSMPIAEFNSLRNEFLQGIKL